MRRPPPLSLVANLLKNAAAPVAIPLRPGRGCLGMDGNPDAVAAVLRQLAEPLAATGFRARGATVAELGPRRTPDLAAALALAGAGRATGFDTSLHVPADAAATARYVRLVELLAHPGHPFPESVGTTARDLVARSVDTSRPRLPIAFTRYDGTRLPVRHASLDLVVSKSVLEHVRLKDVDPLLGEVARVLRPGGRAVHIIDLRDHLHIEGDEGVSGDWLEALRYPEWLYRAMFSNRSTSINRLRRTQWIDRFERAGLGVVCATTVTFPLSPEFNAAALQPPWSDMGEDELRVGILTVAATRSSS